MLGLLSLRPYSTYELAKQMQRSVRWFWPRAERKIYDEPSRLVATGLATSRTEMTGRRASTIYEITDKGRAALREWVGTPEFAPPALEIEGMLKLLFGDAGTPPQMQANLARLRKQAEDAIRFLVEISPAYVAGEDEFPFRRATNAMNLELYVRLYETIRNGTVWAQAEVTSWPPARHQRRVVAQGPPERGAELFAAIGRPEVAPLLGAVRAPVLDSRRRCLEELAWVARMLAAADHERGCRAPAELRADIEEVLCVDAAPAWRGPPPPTVSSPVATVVLDVLPIDAASAHQGTDTGHRYRPAQARQRPTGVLWRGWRRPQQRVDDDVWAQ